MNNQINNIKETVYSSSTIEFVTVAVQYCVFLEKLENSDTEELSDKLTKALPLLYLKALLVAPVERRELEEEIESPVTEEDYNYIAAKIENVLGSKDNYLEVFLDDMQYSDTPLIASISENIADIYQDLRNFVAIYERGIEEHMYDALCICIDSFKTEWGQKLTNVLRALHAIRFPVNDVDGIYDDSNLFESNLDDE